MSPKVALIACIFFVIYLLRIEWKQNPKASFSLWIPTFCLLIMGSRPVGRWFEPSLTYSDLSGGDMAGSPLDRSILSGLILLGIFILSRREIELRRIFKDNFWVFLLYVFLGVSILWSDFQFISFKRWFKIVGPVILAFLVLTEKQPLQALESVIRRCTYILIPFSLLLVKYFGYLGRSYDRWSGTPMWIGVTTHKNSLGALAAISAFFLIWSTLRKWRLGELFKSKSQTYADAIVICISLYLIKGPGESYSATSFATLIIGIILLIILYWAKSFTKFISTYLKTMIIIFVIIFLVTKNLLTPTASRILGRDESLTGRIDIWHSVINIASQNLVIGVGYGGYWGVRDELTSKLGVKQAHNGYLDVFLEVGILGIIILSSFLLEFCSKVQRKIKYSFDWGILGICFLLMELIYNYSETSFLQINFNWTCLVFLSVVFSSSCIGKYKCGHSFPK